MARLPQILSEARIPSVGGAVEDRGAAGVEGLAIARLGGEVVNLASTVLAIERKARDENDVLAAYTDMTQKLDAYRIELDKDPDYASRELKFNAYAKGLEAEHAPKLSRAAKFDFNRRIGSLYASQAHSVRNEARRDELASMRVDLDASVTAMLDSAVTARNGLERRVKIDAIQEAIGRAAATGVLSSAQAKAFHKETLGKLDEVTAMRAMRTNPGQAIRLLDDRAATPSLDPIRREQLKIQAQGRLEQMGALAKADTAAGVAAVIDAFSKGNLKPANLEDVRAKALAFPKLSQQLHQAEYVYNSAADFTAKSIPEQRTIIASAAESEKAGRATPTDTALRDAYEKIHANLVKSYAADPGATAMRRAPAVAEALAVAERALADPAATPADRAAATERFRAGIDTLADQQRADGQPEHRIRFLTKPGAEALEAGLQGPGPKALAILQAQRDAYGPVLWSRVLRQLDEGKKLPMAVKILGAMPGNLAGSKDAITIMEAMSLPDAKIDELIPDKDARSKFKELAGASGEAARLTMSRTPGEIEAYADYASTAQRVAEYLFATKRASSPEAATRAAWNIVWGNHWAAAGTVRVPKVDKVPVIDPDMVSAFGDYVRVNLGAYYLAAPAAHYATRLLSEAQRLDQWRSHLARFGALTVDRAETGVMLRDGEGMPVRGRNGQVIGASWTEIAADKAFQAWWRSQQRLTAPAIHPGLERDPVLEKMLRLPIEPGGLPYEGR